MSRFYGDAMRRITARSAALSAIFLAGALALGGCSAGGGASDSGSERRRGSAPMAPDSRVSPRASRRVDAGGEVGTGGKSVTDNRDLITIGTVTVTTEDPIAAARDAVRIVEGAGGRIDARSEHSATERSGRLRDAGPAHPRERAHHDPRPHQGARLRRRGRHQVDRRDGRAPGPDRPDLRAAHDDRQPAGAHVEGDRDRRPDLARERRSPTGRPSSSRSRPSSAGSRIRSRCRRSPSR